MNDVQKEAETLTANCTHGLEFAETAEHYADLRTRIRACIAYQIMQRDEARKGKTLMEFLHSTVYGHHQGRIVSSGDLTTLQIAEAQACGRFFVDCATNLGWALLPWNITTDKDRAREHGLANIYKAIPPTYTENPLFKGCAPPYRGSGPNNTPIAGGA